jgi:hypothetical protein
MNAYQAGNSCNQIYLVATLEYAIKKITLVCNWMYHAVSYHTFLRHMDISS